MESNSNLPTYIVTASSFAFSAVASRFPQLLKCDNQYGSVLPRISLLATLLYLASYEQCSTQLLKMLHKRCNTDMLEVLLIYPHSSSGAACPRHRKYISVKPLAAVLQPINVCSYACMYVCIVYVCMMASSIY